jgi:hypothetical protein
MFHDDGIHTFLANFLFACPLLLEAGESWTTRSSWSRFFNCAEYGMRPANVMDATVAITQVIR